MYYARASHTRSALGWHPTYTLYDLERPGDRCPVPFILLCYTDEPDVIHEHYLLALYLRGTNVATYIHVSRLHPAHAIGTRVAPRTHTIRY